MRKWTSGVALVALSLASTSCALIDGRCGERGRDVGVTGRITNASDPEAGFVQLVLVEKESTEPRQSGYWLLIDESLRGQVTAARLRRVSGDLLMELDIRLTVPGSQVTYEGQISAATPTAFSELYGLVESNQTMLIVRTSVPGRDSLSTALRLAHSNPWGQPYCS